MNAIAAPPEARDLTPQEQQERVDLCFDIEQKIKENLHAGRTALWELAKNLYEFNEQNGWTALGYETQEEWLAQPDIGLTRTQYFRMVRRWKELVVYREIPVSTLTQLEPSKVDIVLPAIEGNATEVTEEILGDVQSLGARDLREKYVRPSSPPPPKKKDEDDHGVSANGAGPDDAPVSADDVGKEEREAAAKEHDKLVHAGTSVDSWVSVGGDRRKAQRNWAALQELHPVLQALATMEACIEGGPEAPNRTEAKEAWETLKRHVGIEVQEV